MRPKRELSAVRETVLSRRALGNLVWSASGPQGPQGPQGPKGDAGADGARGAAIISGQAHTLPSVTGGGAFRRAPLYGANPVTTPVSENASLSPNRPIVARDMAVRVLGDVPAGGSTIVELVANPNGSLSDPIVGRVEMGCTISDTGGPNDKTCTAPGPITIAPDQLLFMRVSVNGAATANDPQRAFWGITVEPG